MARGDFAQPRGLGTAARHGVRAARVKMAAARGIERRRNFAADGFEFAVPQVHARHLLEQRAGIGMIGRAEQHRGGRALDHAPEIP